MLVIATIVCTLVTLLLIYLTLRNNLYLRKIPKPEANVFLGHLIRLRKYSELLKAVTEFTQKYGAIIRLYIPPLKPLVVVADRDLLKNILNNENVMDKSGDYRFFKVWLGEGLFTAQGAKWRNRRKILIPCFGRISTLKNFVQVFESIGDEVVKKFNEQLDNPSFDVLPYMKWFTMEAICNTSMGISMKCGSNDIISYCHGIEEMTKIALRRIMSPWKRFDYFYKFTSEYRQQTEALKKIDAFYEEIISNKRKIATLNSVKQEKEKSKQDFLDQLLQHQENDNTFSDRDIKDEVNTFLFGGHDATSAGLSFILYTLARHPEVQEKILEEQEALFGSLKNEPLTTYAHLQEMKYLEAVINEALRLYPPAPIVARSLRNDIKLDNGIILPKSLVIICGIYAVHHNPKYFPDPEKFLPERFLKDEILPYTHLPFSAGTRNCIGKKFAMLQMKSCISKIIRHFKLMPSVPEYKLELVPEIILKSKSGIRISLQRRK